jgi:hypothetical protein
LVLIASTWRVLHPPRPSSLLYLQEAIMDHSP